ncbi:Transposon, En/Spm-like protein [Corchorus capsularis]|uniref:Transposon, En/Spm-like protein n=1 Tax=Corchorus capsularis TaxID=210143 RepID=A0A1R3GX34_COCAP|nr:Transposon, En/Spm-like protein [Corchorus capsularis]
MLDKKKWLNCSRLSKQYTDGVKRFIDYAFVKGAKGRLVCNHLICKGVDQGYTDWKFHGERSSPSMSFDHGERSLTLVSDDDGESIDDDIGMVDESNMHDNLEQLVRDVMTQEGNDDHTTSHEDNDDVSDERKIMKGLDLEYDKIDACPNDCMLYWGNDAAATCCNICEASRWHEKGRTKDLKLRHPTDSEAGKAFDSLFPDFAKDPRNICSLLTFGREYVALHSVGRFSFSPLILDPVEISFSFQV